MLLASSFFAIFLLSSSSLCFLLSSSPPAHSTDHLYPSTVSFFPGSSLLVSGQGQDLGVRNFNLNRKTTDLTRLVGYLRIYPTRVFSAFRAYMQRGVCVCVFNFGLEDRDLKPKTSKWRSSMSIVNIRQRLALTREIFRTMKYGKRESYIFVSGSR